MLGSLKHYRLPLFSLQEWQVPHASSCTPFPKQLAQKSIQFPQAVRVTGIQEHSNIPLHPFKVLCFSNIAMSLCWDESQVHASSSDLLLFPFCMLFVKSINCNPNQAELNLPWKCSALSNKMKTVNDMFIWAVFLDHLILSLVQHVGVSLLIPAFSPACYFPSFQCSITSSILASGPFTKELQRNKGHDSSIQTNC